MAQPHRLHSLTLGSEQNFIEVWRFSAVAHPKGVNTLDEAQVWPLSAGNALKRVHWPAVRGDALPDRCGFVATGVLDLGKFFGLSSTQTNDRVKITHSGLSMARRVMW